MKDQLKVLYKTSKKEYDIWSYLWIFSEKSKVSFSYTSLSSQFNIPISTLHRIINKNISKWAKEGIDICIQKADFKANIISFKSAKTLETKPLNEDLYAYLKQYYSQIDYDYPDLIKQINQVYNALISA